MSECLAAALWYAERGWRTVPEARGKKAPWLPEWQRAASTDAETIRGWGQERPDAGVGIATGEGSGIFVFDVDPGHGGNESLAALEAAHGPLPETQRVRTGGGGTHHYFRWPGFDVRNSAGRLGPGLDVRGAGGQVVAPPTVHPDTGEEYEWETGPDVIVAVAPGWLLGRLRPARRQSSGLAEKPSIRGGSAYGRKALDSEAATVAAAPEGARNDTLIRSAFRVGRLVAGGEIERTAGAAALVSAALAAGLEEPEAADVVGRAIEAGTAEPRRAPPRRGAPAAEGETHAPAPRPDLRVVPGGGEARKIETERARIAGLLPRDQYGRIRGTALAVRPILEEDPDQRGRWWWDSFRDWTHVGDRLVVDCDGADLRVWLEREYGIVVGTDTIWEQVAGVAHCHARDPLRDWLLGLPPWDGVERVAGWLSALFGVEETQLARAEGAAWAVGCVARVMEPGCKLDTCMVLVGPQGSYKSSTLRALVGAEWFSDTDLDLDSKDVYMRLRTAWVHELAELSALSRSRQERIKSLLSSQEDEYRSPYGRTVQRVKRRCVLVGTSNPSDILRDPTGSRRFWPVRTRGGDPERAAAIRDGFWAEALALHRRGTSWWLSPEGEAERATDARNHEEEDPWESAVAGWCIGKPEVRPADALTAAVKLGLDKQDIPSVRRIAACLRRLGYAPGWTAGGDRTWRRIE